MIKSVEEGKWLSSQAVDFFIAHLEKAILDQKLKMSIKFNRVSWFENLISSGNMSDLSAKITFDNVKEDGKIFEKFFTIFISHPLIIFPFNRDQSHFCIAYIRTESQYAAGCLSKVNFEIGYFDPMGSEELNVFNHLKSYIIKQVETYANPSEYNVYNDAVKNIKYKVSKDFNLTHQNNSYDCGIFICLYAFIIAAHFGLGIELPQIITRFPHELAKELRQWMLKDFYFAAGNLIPWMKKRLVKP